MSGPNHSLWFGPFSLLRVEHLAWLMSLPESWLRQSLFHFLDRVAAQLVDLAEDRPKDLPAHSVLKVFFPSRAVIPLEVPHRCCKIRVIRWFPLAGECHLGREVLQLGESTHLGARTPRWVSLARVILFLEKDRARLCLPGSPGWWRLNGWVRASILPYYEVSLEIQLKRCPGGTMDFRLGGEKSSWILGYGAIL